MVGNEWLLIVTHLVAAGIGAWAYRYMLRRDPEALERLAQQIRDAGRRIG